MTTHNDSRLSVDDCARISERVAEFLDRSAGMIESERFTTAERIAHRAIGCDERDLRPIELRDIAAQVRRLMAPSVTA